MNLTIISILRIALAGALAALTRAAPAGAAASIAAPLCKDDEPDCSPRPFDLLAVQATPRTVG